MYCDLHTHSVYSDGTETPENIIRLAEKIGLYGVALCDHNTVDGLYEFNEKASGSKVICVNGVEFSTDYFGEDLHILGLFVPKNKFEEVKNITDDYFKRKVESNKKLVYALACDGYLLDYDEIQSKTKKGNVNRAHIALELVNKGYISTPKQGYENLLLPNGRYYIPPKKISSEDAVKFIKKIGAVPVLAHPLVTMNPEKLKEFLEKGVKWGIAGMETDYSEYNENDTRVAKQLALQYGIAFSGGSDYHGNNKPGINLGTGRGTLKIPKEYLISLKP